MADVYDFFNQSAAALNGTTSDSGNVWAADASAYNATGSGSVYAGNSFGDGTWPTTDWVPASANYSAAVVVGADAIGQHAHFGPGVRITGSAPTQSGYFAVIQWVSSAWELDLYYVVGADATVTQIGTAQPVTPATGDVWTLQVAGTSNPVTLTVFQNGAEVYAANDTAALITSAGTAGFRLADDGTAHPDQLRAFWAGSNASGPPAITIAPTSVSLAYSATQSFTLSTAFTNETFTWGASHGSISGTAATETYTAPGSGSNDAVMGTSTGFGTRVATASVTLPSPSPSPTPSNLGRQGPAKRRRLPVEKRLDFPIATRTTTRTSR